jgi:hypothetical protein
VVELELAERGEQLEADVHPLLPGAARLLGGRHRVQRQPAPEQQRVAHPHALVAAVGQPELGAQRLPGGEQVEPVPGRRVDGHHGLAAPEAVHGARDLLDGARLVEGRDQLQPVGPAPLVERAQLLVGGLGRDVDAAVAHGAGGMVAAR